MLELVRDVSEWKWDTQENSKIIGYIHFNWKKIKVYLVYLYIVLPFSYAGPKILTELDKTT